jgi:hypothetical protein
MRNILERDREEGNGLLVKNGSFCFTVLVTQVDGATGSLEAISRIVLGISP